MRDGCRTSVVFQRVESILPEVHSLVQTSCKVFFVFVDEVSSTTPENDAAHDHINTEFGRKDGSLPAASSARVP